MSPPISLYDGHVETWHKTRLGVPEDIQKPHRPGMWVVKPEIWQQDAAGP